MPEINNQIVDRGRSQADSGLFNGRLLFKNFNRPILVLLFCKHKLKIPEKPSSHVSWELGAETQGQQLIQDSKFTVT